MMSSHSSLVLILKGFHTNGERLYPGEWMSVRHNKELVKKSKNPLFPNWLPSTQRVIFLRARPAVLNCLQ